MFRLAVVVLQSISKLAFDFERRKLAIEEVRELIYREILEYHPQVLQDYLSGGRLPTFLYPSAVDNFKRQFIHLEGGGEKHVHYLSGFLCSPAWSFLCEGSICNNVHGVCW